VGGPQTRLVDKPDPEIPGRSSTTENGKKVRLGRRGKVQRAGDIQLEYRKQNKQTALGRKKKSGGGRKNTEIEKGCSVPGGAADSDWSIKR